MIATAAAIIIPTLLGFLSISILLRRDSESGIVERVCMAYPLGVGLVTMQMFVSGVFRVPLTFEYSVFPVIIEIAVLSLWIWKKRIPLISLNKNLAGGYATDKSNANYSLLRTIVCSILAVWIIAKMGSVFVETYLRPIFAWDAWANWSARAKVFYYSESLLLDAPHEEFFGKGVVLSILTYPLNSIMMQVWMSLWTGEFDEVLVKMWSPFYLLSITVYLYIFTSRKINRLFSLLFVTIFISSPLMSYHGIEVYSDLMVGAYLFLSLVSFTNVLQGRLSYLPLIGIFCAIAMFTKDEAIFFTIPLLISLFYHLINKKEFSYKNVLLVLLPFIYIVPWLIFKFTHNLGLGADVAQEGLRIVFHPEVIIGVIESVISLENFNLIFVFFPLLFVINGKPDREFLHLLFVIVFYGMFFIAVYAFSSFYAENFYKKETFIYRNMLTYYPVLSLLNILLIKSIREKIFSASIQQISKE